MTTMSNNSNLIPLDPITLNQLQTITTNILTTRSSTSGWASLIDPRRNLEQECGYPEGAIAPETLYQLYRKDCIARRAVQVWADEGWSVTPDVYDVEDTNKVSPFEKAWLDLPSSISSPVHNYSSDHESNPIWQWLQLFDEMSGIGTYGVMLYGLDDGVDLSQPVVGFIEENSTSLSIKKDDYQGVIKNKRPHKGVYRLHHNVSQTSGRKLLYLRVFPEYLAQIASYETNPSSPRYGLPTSYLLSFNDQWSSHDTSSMPTSSITVHWTRVQHLVVQMESSITYGTPVLEPILPRVLDLRKIYASSAEGYYRLGFPGISFETHPTLGGDVDISISNTRSQLEQYMNGMQRYLIGLGMTAKTLPPSVTDPIPFIEKQLQAICMALDIPQRVFMGSERGELSSGQDDRRHKGKCRKRRTRFQSPRMLGPMINSLIAYGVLPIPDGGFKQVWPDQDTQTEDEKADVSVKKTQSLVSYRASGADDIMAPKDFMVDILGMTIDRADAVLKSAKKFQDETGGLEPLEQGISGSQVTSSETAGKDPAGVGSLKGKTGIKTK